MTHRNPGSTPQHSSRRGLRARTHGLILLGASLLLAACGGDSSAGPRDEDGETLESRLARPETVRDLAVESVGSRSVTLQFTEVSDGVNPNRVASYEVRYHATPIRNGWNNATVVGNGTCAAPIAGTQVGSVRTCTVEGLPASASIDFQMVAFRRQGQTTTYGQLSNVVTARTGSGGSVAGAMKMEGDNQSGVVGTALSHPLAVKVRDQSGNGVPGVTVNWSANGGGGSVSSATTVTDQLGYARVTRTLGTVRGENRTTAYVNGAAPLEFLATAEAGPVTRVTVLPSEVSLNVGDSTAMVALLEDQYGNHVTGPSVTWASSNSSVATVRTNGQVIGRAGGVAGVTASVAGISSSGSTSQTSAQGGSTVRVLDAATNTPSTLAAVAGAGQSGTVGSALAQPFVVEVRNAAGDLMGGVSVAWSVTNGGGSLSTSSSVTGTNGRAQVLLTLGTVAGSNEVRATVQGLTPVAFTAQGQAGPLASITVTPGSTSVGVGGTREFAAALRDQYGNTVSGTPTWSSSSNAVASVNSSGVASGVATGSATIRASAGGRVGQASLTVTTTTSSGNPGTVTTLAVAGTSETSVTLRFTSVSDGTGSPANYQIRFAPTPLGWGWGSATPVAQGSCAGAVTSSSVGQQVTCTAEGLPSGASLDFQLVAYRGNLGPSAVFGNLSNIATGQTGASSPTGNGTVTISPRGGTLTAIGATLQLSATARDGSGATITNPGATWSSSNTNVATVDASGRVTARGLGSAIISVAAACCTGDQVPVTVSPQISSITVTPATSSIAVGATNQLSASARDSNGNLIPDVMFSWSSSSSAIAGVNGTGLVTGVAAGSASITASAGGRSGSASVTVSGGSTPPPPPPPSGSTGWPSSRPSNIVFVTENTFPGTITPSGWEYHQRSSVVRYVTDSSKPFSGQGAGEWLYTVGMGSGHNDPGAVGTSRVQGQREIFVGFLVRHSPGFVEQIPGTKFCHFMLSGGQNLFISKASPNQVWREMYGNEAGQWAIASTGWSGGPNGPAAWNDNNAMLPGGRPSFNNVNPTAALVDFTGGWQSVEVHLRFSSSPTTSDGIVRMWIDGVLTADYRQVQWPSGSFGWAPDCAGTFGGGSLTVQREQWFRIGHIWVGRGS